MSIPQPGIARRGPAWQGWFLKRFVERFALYVNHGGQLRQFLPRDFTAAQGFQPQVREAAAEFIPDVGSLWV